MALVDETTPYVEYKGKEKFIIRPPREDEYLEVHRYWEEDAGNGWVQPETALVFRAKGWNVDDARRWIQM